MSILTTKKHALIEPSFADAITMIGAAEELREQTRRHWSTSLRQVAKALDKPIEVIPARYSAVRAELGLLQPRPFKTIAAIAKAPCSGWRARKASLSMARP